MHAFIETEETTERPYPLSSNANSRSETPVVGGGQVLSSGEARTSWAGAGRFPEDAHEQVAAEETRISVVRGRSKLLAQEQRLAALAARCRLPFVLDRVALELQFHIHNFGPKRPVVLFLSDKDGVDRAAVLLHEYTLYKVRTGLYVPFDPDGECTLIAAAEDRAWVVSKVVAFLFRRGAKVLLLNASGGDSFLGSLCASPHALQGRTYGVQTREIHRSLELSPVYDETLRKMGAHTRRNLRYYRRKLEQNFQAQFVPSVDLTEAEFLKASEACSHPVPEEISRWRWRHYGKVPGTFLTGLRAGNGRWLSMIGGRRQGANTRLDWQRNIVEQGSGSVVAAMRGWFIEHEISLGMRSLRFDKGTTHSLCSALTPEPLHDILFVHPLLSPARVNRWLVRWLPAGSALASVVNQGRFAWHTC